MYIGLIADGAILIGEVIIAYAVIAVHDRMREEHRIDDAVYKAMTRERHWIVFGVFLLFAGFSLRLFERIIG